ncbi:hypothetical protein ETB97_006002 [Aspergillus alliaceus]|uniref:Uncharacterized protein n=1 Tax=Petromyces alliaceus TaxID=209559 RepID=A0A8H5ZXX4_PETAA|nr:hypothetical protein ETB97_006002 [Aspergillus burnettii]
MGGTDFRCRLWARGGRSREISDIKVGSQIEQTQGADGGPDKKEALAETISEEESVEQHRDHLDQSMDGIEKGDLVGPKANRLEDCQSIVGNRVTA